MTEINARVILDSAHPEEPAWRLTTVEVTYPRFVHSELMTHRVMSRNSASSRAISFAKMLERVRTDPAMPVSWPREQKGMQGGEELDDVDRGAAREFWLEIRDHVADAAEYLVAETGLHKSVANRLLEPWAWMTVLITATDWDNFFALRCRPNAQPELRVAAEAIRDARAASTPRALEYGQWHLPLVTGIDEDAVRLHFAHGSLASIEQGCRLISAARCARVSYLTHDGKRDLEADFALANRLLHPPDGGPPHASPFEHVALPAHPINWFSGDVPGNLRGWRPFRHEVEADRRMAP